MLEIYKANKAEVFIDNNTFSLNLSIELIKQIEDEMKIGKQFQREDIVTGKWQVKKEVKQVRKSSHEVVYDLSDLPENVAEILKAKNTRGRTMVELHKLGLSNKEISFVMKANPTHVYKVIKRYTK